MGIKTFVLALLANLSLAVAAQAAPVTWYLQDVGFDDGGTAVGSFVFDADAGVFSDINVTTTAGSALDGETYDVPLPSSPGNATFLSFANSAGIADFTGYDAIGIELDSAMTNLGGLILIKIAGFALESRCVTADCFAVADPLRRITSGYITTSEVPLPAALPLFLAGLAGLGFVKRKHAAPNVL
ncbi:VPLPA-CTERM sorting domain-containing protein [Hyphococcus sp.]|jgi:hypothetical protein|uniref:VPLPA-CTERM sorting domain-containing protein n=1 Tax=Hyphococcus sp. TaxID=2038636 RepID=UPI003D136E92